MGSSRDWRVEFDNFFVDEQGIRWLDDPGPGTHEPRELTVNPMVAHLLMRSKSFRINERCEAMGSLLSTYIAGHIGEVTIKVDPYLPFDQGIVVRPSVVNIKVIE